MEVPAVADDLDHYYTYGDVYETLDVCDQLELHLGRLKRQRLIDEQAWAESRKHIAEIRARLEPIVHQSHQGA